LNEDGVKDVIIEFAGRSHFWYGGADLESRIAAGRSSGVMHGTTFGASGITRSWRVANIDADAASEFVMDTRLNDREAERRSRQGFVATGPLRIFGLDALRGGILDSNTVPDVEWFHPDLLLWGLGDFDGDGFEDLLLGASPAQPGFFALKFGPVSAE
jgi:hypothetical protein